MNVALVILMPSSTVMPQHLQRTGWVRNGYVAVFECVFLERDSPTARITASNDLNLWPRTCTAWRS